MGCWIKNQLLLSPQISSGNGGKETQRGGQHYGEADSGSLQTFPGVIRVIDQLSIDTNAGASAGANAGASVVPAAGANGAVTAGARSPVITNRPVLTPTGRPIPTAPGGFTTLSNTPPVTTP